MAVLTIVVPCYNEEKVLPVFYRTLIQTVEIAEMPETIEILFVDDGSGDNTLGLIKQMAEEDERVHYLSFSRNFGKEAAIFAGLEHAGGDYVAVMDADLQDPPEYLLPMYRGIVEEGYDAVAMRRVNRKGEPLIRSVAARAFYKLINRLSKTQIADGARDYRMMTRQMVEAVCRLREVNRFSKGIFGWVGFNVKWLEYENARRAAGESKWSFWKLLLYSIEGITAFSTMPLVIAAGIGILMCLIAVIAIIFIIIRELAYGGSAFGWPSMACIVIFIGGIQLLGIGVLGQYLAKTYMEVKKRPIYIVKERSEGDSNDFRKTDADSVL